MNLQLFVNDSTFNDNAIQITGITKHIIVQGTHLLWVSGEVSDSARRFYVGDNDAQYRGADYAIPTSIALYAEADENPMKLLPAGTITEAIEVSEPDLRFLPTSEIDEVVSILLKSERLHSRTAGYVRLAATSLSCKTLKDISKKTTKSKLREMPGVGEKVVSTYEQLLSSVGLRFRE